MTDKYKIYLSEDTKTRLINDAELFEFTKDDGTVNLNGFLKELIVNYFEQYRKDNAALMNGLIEDLSSAKGMKQKEASVLAERIIRTYINAAEPASSKSVVITLTVSGESFERLFTVRLYKGHVPVLPVHSAQQERRDHLQAHI